MNNFKIQLSEKVADVENVIYSYCPKEEGLQAKLFEAINYSVKAGGKRLRPLLMQETYRLFSDDIQDLEPFMAAIEFIHTYSLVHDDLPAMDNDEYRRGKKTTHAVYGEDMGILAGDGLLNMAYEIMSKAVVEAKRPDLAARAMSVLATKAGSYGMVGGQVVDVLNENKQMDLDTVLFIHNLKTAALIEASMMCGAIMAGASEEDVVNVEKIAKNIGIAFQIQDDILDIIGDEQKLGKPVMSDEKNCKSTYVTLKGLEKSKADVAKLSNDAIDMLNSFKYSNDFLINLVTQLINREK